MNPGKKLGPGHKATWVTETQIDPKTKAKYETNKEDRRLGHKPTKPKSNNTRNKPKMKKSSFRTGVQQLTKIIIICGILLTLLRQCQITKLNGAAFHPETVRQAGRAGAAVVRTLALFVDENQKNWCEALYRVVLADRTTPHATIKITPFETLFGRQAKLPQMEGNLLDHLTDPQTKEKGKTMAEHIRIYQEKTAETREFPLGTDILLKVKMKGAQTQNWPINSTDLLLF